MWSITKKPSEVNGSSRDSAKPAVVELRV